MTKLVEKANLWGKGVVRSGKGGTEEEDVCESQMGRTGKGNEKGQSNGMCIPLVFQNERMEMGCEGGEKKKGNPDEGKRVGSGLGKKGKNKERGKLTSATDRNKETALHTHYGAAFKQ